MYEDMNERLAELKEKGRKKEKWEKRHQQLQEELAALERAREEASRRLAAEEKDVKQLTSLSLSNLLHTILGRKTEKLDQEQREVVEAKLKYDEADQAVQHTVQQIAAAEKQLAEVKFWKLDYDQVFEAKERQVLQENEELRTLAEEQAALSVQNKELEEALRAGGSAAHDLDSAVDKLLSAKNWGTYDMLGGGMISTHMKHGRLDEAMDYLYRAQNSLRHFEKELRDVGEQMPVHIEISGFLKFSDYFFDGFIMDWIVQGKINDMLHQVEGKRSEVNRILSDLAALQRKVGTALDSSRRRYVQTIEQYI
ncbi:hypothetical protein MKX50_11785 [Paenibacillus sp. FSL W8-0186]|uniref:Uncharacterized protein n=1 Tax=Paenibacillus woosongensis TaxID=307580 RepID=A0ABQ4MK69_9BACL|nr:hypothetical protein [Paenibacillus woosongensis]GIP56383.1 hypothetical protein J15TS10_01970 [Paenibacillus woosongensis]